MPLAVVFLELILALWLLSWGTWSSHVGSLSSAFFSVTSEGWIRWPRSQLKSLVLHALCCTNSAGLVGHSNATRKQVQMGEIICSWPQLTSTGNESWSAWLPRLFLPASHTWFWVRLFLPQVTMEHSCGKIMGQDLVSPKGDIFPQ